MEALDKDSHTRLSLVAEQAGTVVGHVLFSELTIWTPSGSLSGLALAPVGVHPEHQRMGIGTQLIVAGLQHCLEQNWRVVIVLGEPSFYGRFGFSAERAALLESPYAGDYFLAVDLSDREAENLSGRVEYPAPFAALA